MKLNNDILNKLIDDGYVMVNNHPSLPLRIYNYTRKTQFEKYWNEYTLLCRGLILDHDLNVIARPFMKFFNYEEHKPEEIPNTNFEVYEKVDGSLGIIFNYANEWHIATRGSFVSEQAIRAKSMLSRYNIDGLDSEKTYLVEIIYPENRIVVDYFGEEKLVLLAVVDIKTGHDMPYSHMKYHTYMRKIDFPLIKYYDGINDIFELSKRNNQNEEGYVLRYENGFRVKIKFENYCRLHAIITNLSTKDIWKYLRDGKDINELLDRTPDEFDDWVRNEMKSLTDRYLAIESEAKLIFSKIYVDGMSRKDFAMKALNENHSPILFKILENKPYDSIIWKMIEPKYSKAFFKEEGN